VRWIELNEWAFEAFVASMGRPTLVVIYSQVSAPCTLTLRSLSTLSAEWDDEIRLARVDVNMSPNLVSRFAIVTLPVLLLYRDGVEVGRRVGRLHHWRMEAFVSTAFPESLEEERR
jgi:thioredoxin 1